MIYLQYQNLGFQLLPNKIGKDSENQNIFHFLKENYKNIHKPFLESKK